MYNTDDLINRYIDPDRPSDARIIDAGVHVWALIGCLRLNGDDVEQTATEYGLPREAVEAAIAYYHRHQAVIDARLTLRASFDDWCR